MIKYILSFLLITNTASAMNSVTRTIQANEIDGVMGFKNLVENSGFERRTRAWTASGGTFTTTTTTADVGSGSRAGSWDSNAASQTLTATAVAIPAGDYGANYEVSANLKCASGTCTHLLQAFDGTNIVASTTITSSLTYARTTLNFVSPTSGNLSARLVSVAADEPLVYHDDWYVGRARNIGSVAQAELVGTVKVTGCSTNWSSTSSSYGDFSAQTGCSYAVTGSGISAPSTNIPGFTISGQPGKYVFVYTGRITASTTASNIQYRMTDGTNSSLEEPSINIGSNAGQDIVPVLDFSFTANQPFVNNIWRIQSKSSASISNGIYGTTTYPGVFKIYRYPLSSEIAVRPELQNLIASAYHSNNCGWARSSSSYGDPAGDASCTFTQVVNSNGTITSALSGSDPLPGIIVTPNTAGTYKVCVNGPSFSTGSGVGALQLLNSTSSVQLGEISSSTYTRIPFYMCGLVQASSISPVTVKLQIRNTAAANADIDVNTSASDRALYWTVEKLTQPSPVITGVGSGSPWWVYATMTGDSPSLGTSGAWATDTPIESSSYTLTNKTGTGVINAEVSCSSTNTSSGSTCSSGSEQIGFAFTPTTTGPAEICINIVHFADTESNSSVSFQYKINKTPNNSQTPDVSGVNIKNSFFGSQSARTYTSSQLEICDIFDVTASTKETFRLVYRGTAGGGSGVNANRIWSDNSGGGYYAWTGVENAKVTFKARPL